MLLQRYNVPFERKIHTYISWIIAIIKIRLLSPTKTKQILNESCPKIALSVHSFEMPATRGEFLKSPTWVNSCKVLRVHDLMAASGWERGKWRAQSWGGLHEKVLAEGEAGSWWSRRSFLLFRDPFTLSHPFYRQWDVGLEGKSCFPGESPGAVWHHKPSTKRRMRRKGRKEEEEEEGNARHTMVVGEEGIQIKGDEEVKWKI